MKTQFCSKIVVVLAFLACGLLGCPMNEPPVVNPPVTTEIGSLHIEGDLSGGQKSISNEQLLAIGQAFLDRADSICAYLYEPMEKGGGEVARFCGTISAGHFVLDSEASHVLIPVGKYELYVNIDGNGYPLFWGRPDGGQVNIGSGSNTADVVFDFMEEYWVTVIVSDVPGNLGDSGNVRLISAEYPQATQWFRNVDGTIGFSFAGPVQFTGGTVVVTDDNGEEFAFDVAVDMATDYFGPIQVSYVPSVNVGSLEIDSEFSFMTKILVNGEIVEDEDLQNAVYSAGSDIEIYVPRGDFYPGDITIPTNVSTVTILGEGVESFLHQCDFSWDRLNYGKTGGETSLTIDGVTLSGEVHVQGVDYFAINNSVVLSGSHAVSLNYVGVADIDHCDFLRYVTSAENGIQITNCGPSPVSVKNSIFANYPVAISYDRPGVYAGSHNCLWNCGYTNWEDVVPSSFIVGNPLWAHNFSLASLSPCIGAGEDGQDIGILQPFVRPVDQDGKVLPALLVTAVDAQSVSVILDPGDFPAVTDGIFAAEYGGASQIGHFVADFLINGAWQGQEIVPGVEYTMPKPTALALRWVYKKIGGNVEYVEYRSDIPVFCDGQLMRKITANVWQVS